MIGARALAKKIKEEYGSRAGKAPSFLAPERKKWPTVGVAVGRKADIALGEKARAMMPKHKTAASEAIAKAVGERLGVDWDDVDFTPKDLAAGMKVEEEHNKPGVDVVPKGQVPKATAEIALAHLTEGADYYDRLKKMEAKMEANSQPSEAKKKEAGEEMKPSPDGSGNGLVSGFKCARTQEGADPIRKALEYIVGERQRGSKTSLPTVLNPMKELQLRVDRSMEEKVKEGQGALIQQAVGRGMAEAAPMARALGERIANPFIGSFAARNVTGMAGGGALGGLGAGAATDWDPAAMAAGAVGGAAAGRLGLGALHKFVRSPRAQKALAEKGVRAGQVSERAAMGQAAGQTAAGPGAQVGAEEAKAFEQQVRRQLAERASASRAGVAEQQLAAQQAAHLSGGTKTAPVKKTVKERAAEIREGVGDAARRVREAVTRPAPSPATAAPGGAPAGPMMGARF
jgi:hypothetical protein